MVGFLLLFFTYHFYHKSKLLLKFFFTVITFNLQSVSFHLLTLSRYSPNTLFRPNMKTDRRSALSWRFNNTIVIDFATPKVTQSVTNEAARFAAIVPGFWLPVTTWPRRHTKYSIYTNVNVNIKKITFTLKGTFKKCPFTNCARQR